MEFNVCRRLCEAIGSWMHLEFCCNRAGLFSESSLKAAVGMVLSSLPTDTRGARSHADVPLAALNPTIRRGRKRSVDFVLALLDGDRNPKEQPEIMIETKWAKSSHCTPENIYQDFVRLAVLKQAMPKSKCLFILAGPHGALDDVLEKMPFETGESKNRGIGSTHVEEKKMTIMPANFVQRSALKEAIHDLQDGGLPVPKAFVTRVFGPYPTRTNESSPRFQCIGWEIKAVSKETVSAKLWR